MGPTKEYRLLKDLPQIKAGSIFVRETTVCDDVYIPSEQRCVWMIGAKSRRARRPVFESEEMEYLVKAGWFEERKDA